jgi:hypothetical protein
MFSAFSTSARFLFGGPKTNHVIPPTTRTPIPATHTQSGMPVEGSGGGGTGCPAGGAGICPMNGRHIGTIGTCRNIMSCSAPIGNSVSYHLPPRARVPRPNVRGTPIVYATGLYAPSGILRGRKGVGVGGGGGESPGCSGQGY